ncbi:multiple monosaccharide ABC transporter substrate-binding protein [Microbacterium sp. SCN 69-37]|uniref:multiple monosaccharide ABC transporter substrate-binding protein n=1 Tax=Microbacterium sp. SCN 69-37 TaxID=1660115 RepID=UPI00086B568D|nr:multiple monosaccharide ABC transporter substrate-binding protein [Microbacterium sp. SCN 69-37]ODT24485.1 MAG: ABC transporter substrate-binding protein [Microbacterium sp. SCN 69-37]
MLKKIMTGAAIAALAVSLAACSSTKSGDTGSTDAAATTTDCNVGIAMPTRSLERWINDGEQLQKKLTDAGCKVDLQYADNKTDQQISQIQNQIAGGAKILVIAAIDGSTLGPVLDEAKAQNATVIAYDRLINGSKNVDYYATFDNYKVGQLQGKFIEDKLGLASGKGPFNLEPFAGSPDDNNAKFFFAGAWDVLKPYVDKGQLVVPSGKAPANDDAWASIGIQGWASDKAQSEMDNRLSSFYGDGKKVNVVLSPNDSLAIGIEASLKSAGYTAGDAYPIITGQDADKANVKAILDGLQSMTVWKDTRALGDRVFTMIQEITQGKEVEVNDSETYNNGVKVVPSYLLTPEVVTKDDVQTKLIDSGFLKASDVGL